jgi:DNA polymerase-3 subunit delta
MIPAKGSIGRAIDRPDPAIRFYLFLGPDDSHSRILADRLLKSLGAEKFVIAAASLKADPALLADEAAAIGLFGGKRLLWIDPAGEDITAAVEALLHAPSPESPVVAIAGDLKRSSALRKLAESSNAALAHVSYAPDDDSIARIVADMARAEGLSLSAGTTARLAAACGNDRAVIAQELAKLATFLDASTDAPKELYSTVLDAVGAGAADGGFGALADLALSGDLPRLADELDAMGSAGSDTVMTVRALQRRLLMVAPIRARVEVGETASSVMASLGKALFWKDKDVVGPMVAAWDSVRLARVAARVGKLERDLMLGDAPRAEALGEELVAIARAARRR